MKINILCPHGGAMASNTGCSDMWVRKPLSTSSLVGNDDVELDGIPLADLRSKDSVPHDSQLVTAYPTPAAASPAAAPSWALSASPSNEQDGDLNQSSSSHHLSPSSSPSRSSSTSASEDSVSLEPTPCDSPSSAKNPSSTPAETTETPLRSHSHENGRPPPAAYRQQPPPPLVKAAFVQPEQQQQPTRQQQPTSHHGLGFGGGGAPAAAAAAIKTGEYVRGIAAEARAWSARALAGASGSGGGGGGWIGRSGVWSSVDDAVTKLLPDSAVGDRIGGPAGRGPLLRRLRTTMLGMLDDFVVVTFTRPGPLCVRLKPDPRGLVILNNFDPLPDDPHTSCPRLGPLESVGSVMPGDALVSVNREVLLGRPFPECVKCIREACATASVAFPCVLCFRRADPECLEETLGAPPRNIEQEKLRSLQDLLKGDEGGLLDEARLRGITSTGVPDQGGLRPVLWRVLLRCLPANRMKWPEHLEAQRALYARFVNDLVLNPAKVVTQGGAESFEESKTGSTSPSDVRDGGDLLIGNFGFKEVLLPQGDPGRTQANKIHPEEQRGANSGCLEQETNRNEVDQELKALTAESGPPSSTPPSTNPAHHSYDGSRRPADDDPLSNKETSEWAALWSDKELMQAIDQDVIRTMPDLAFYACRGREEDDDLNDSMQIDGENRTLGVDVARGEEQRRRGRERREALARILFVHAKLNPAESYTQGMNEIVATLFFVLATEGDDEWKRHCEADTFFCFTNLMAEIRDVFIQSMDDSESGLHGKMEAFSKTLQHHDPELAKHMVKLALDPRYFALRWFTTLLSREFDLPDTIRLWDSLFAAPDRSKFLVFVFVTLLLAQREELLAGDFASNLQLLQAYPPTAVPEIIAQSEALRLFSARGDAARGGDLAAQRAREAADGAMHAAEQVNAAARRFWNAASDLASFHLSGERA